jgi:hypothetical protein
MALIRIIYTMDADGRRAGLFVGDLICLAAPLEVDGAVGFGLLPVDANAYEAVV